MKGLKQIVIWGMVWGILSVLGMRGQTATNLFISEYVEGTSYNKAIEIYNGTGGVVELSDYTVELYRGGETEWDRQANLGDFQFELADGETLVLRNSQSSTIGYDSSVVGFTGDDAIVLSEGGVILDVVGVIGSSENRLPNMTIRRNEAVLSPRSDYLETEWVDYAVDSFEGLGSHQLGSPDGEPSNQVTDLVVEQVDVTAFVVKWTDAEGGQLPRGYLVLVSEGVVALPIDGEVLEEDGALEDGSAVYLVGYGEEAVEVEGLKSDTEYLIQVIPYSNQGELIDYNTEGSLGSGKLMVRSAPYLLSEQFESLERWQVVTRGSETEWELIEGEVRANAFGSIGPAEDWLISPKIDFDQLEDLVMRFETKVDFTDLGMDGALTVWVSTDYSGTESAFDQANWELIDVPLPKEGAGELEATPNIGLGAYAGNGYIAFRYESSGVGLNKTEGWTLDDFCLYSSAETAPRIEITFEPGSVVETAGKEAIVGTIRLSRATATALEVEILKSEEVILAMPERVTLLAGAASSSFYVDVLETDGLKTAKTIEVKARGEGHIGGSGRIEVWPAAERYLETSINLSEIDEGTEGVGQLEVRLSRAPESYPYSVAIETSDRTEIEVGRELTFEAADGLVKTIGLTGVDDGVFDGDEAVTITVRSDDYGSDSSTVWVRNIDEPPPLLLEIGANPVFENEGMLEGLVRLGGEPLQGYPVTIEIEVSDLSELGLPSEAIRIDAEDGGKAVFRLPIQEDGEVDGTQTVEIAAKALNYRSDSIVVEVLDIDREAEGSVIGVRIEPEAIEEGKSGVGTIILSRRTEADLEILLINGNPGKLSIPETVVVPGGQAYVQFTVMATDDGLINEDEGVTVYGLAEGWVGGETRIVVVNDDVERLLSLSLGETSLSEGDSTLATVSMNRRSSEGVMIEIGQSDDLEMPERVMIPAGSLSASFLIKVIEGDGWEGDETEMVRIYGSGYEGVEVGLSILENENRVRLSKPKAGETFAAGETIMMEAEVSGEVTTVERVIFVVDGEEAGGDFEVPYRGGYAVPLDAEVGGSLMIRAQVVEKDGTDYWSEPVEVEVQFNPVLNVSDFIRQVYADTMGEPITESRYADYLRLFERSENRNTICNALFEESGMEAVEEAMAVFYLLEGRFPSREDLYERGLSEGTLLRGYLKDAGIDLPPIIEYIESGEAASYGDETNPLRGGLLGLIQLVFEYGSEDSGGLKGSGLTHMEWFERIWVQRHGVEPTAQQILQANTRIESFMGEQAEPFLEMEPLAYGRARLVWSLIEEERFLWGTEVIYNPPNERWKGYVRAAIMVLMGWEEGEWTGTEAELEGKVGEGDEVVYASIFEHPNYWERFDYGWLRSRRTEAGSDWRQSDWFGWIAYNGGNWPWIYHWEHGWIYGNGDNEGKEGEGIWYYDLWMGWVWTNGIVYPWMYEGREGDWVYYMEGSKEPRWIYERKKGAWEAEGE